jgi:hypothetical protein
MVGRVELTEGTRSQLLRESPAGDGRLIYRVHPGLALPESR